MALSVDSKIKDIMKTLDNRHVMNMDVAKQFGMMGQSTEEPES